VRREEYTPIFYEALAIQARIVEMLERSPAAAAVLRAKKLSPGRGAVTKYMAAVIPKAIGEALGGSPAEVEIGAEAGALWREADRLRWQVTIRFRWISVDMAASICGYLDKDDMIAEGMIGLHSAARRYDPGVSSFITFANWWVRAALTRAADGSAPVKRSHSLNAAYRDYRKLKKSYPEKIRGMSDAEIAQRSGMSTEMAARVRVGIHFTSMDQAIGVSRWRRRRDWKTSLAQVLRSEAPMVDDVVGMMLLADRAERTMRELVRSGRLSARDLDVFRLRVGGCGDRLTLREISDRLGLSKQRANQIEHDTRALIRDAMRHKPTQERSAR